MASSATSLVPPGQGYNYNYNQAGYDNSPASSTAHLYSTSGTFAPTQPQSPAAETTGVLLERSEIDKSLKALENLVTVLYEYTQLTSSLAGMDKKLTKALKEASGMKRGAVSGDISGGAVDWPCSLLQTASNLLDVQTNLNAAYSKLVEKEYESTTSELKKWLKKLKKEDKGLDEYTAGANAKIKSAGIAYQKSVGSGGGRFKKSLPPPSPSSNSNGALDNYTNILSTLTTSINSAKHQHALFASDRHISVLFSISGSVGRIADAHWQRTTELIRRSAQYIGPLGQGRAYVEGGWRGGSTAGDLFVNLPVADANERDSMQREGNDALRKYEQGSRPESMARTPVPTIGRGAAQIAPISAQNTSEPAKAATLRTVPNTMPYQSIQTPDNKAPQLDVLGKIADEIRTSLGYASNDPGLGMKKEEVKSKEEKKDEPTPKATIKDSAPPKSEPTTNSTGTFTSGTTRTTVSREPESSSSSESPFVVENNRAGSKPTLSDSPIASTSLAATSPSDDRRISPTTAKSNSTPSDKGGLPPRLPTPPTLPSVEEASIFQPTKALARTPAAAPAMTSTAPSMPVPSGRLHDPPTGVFAPEHTLARTPMHTSKEPSPMPDPAQGTKSPPPLSPLNTGGRERDGEAYFAPFVGTNANGMTRDGPSPPSSYGGGPYSPTSQPPSTHNTGTGPPRPGPKPLSRVGRTMSIDSTTSNGSVVAAMRERYTAASPPPASGPVPLSPQHSSAAVLVGRDRDRYNAISSPPPASYAARDPYSRRESDRERARDWDAPPKVTGRVSDMASRFTPIEGPTRDGRYLHGEDSRYPRSTNPYAQSDTLPIRSPLPVRRSMDEFGMSPNPSYEGRKAAGLDTMPTPERRGTMPVGVGLGIGQSGDRSLAGVGSGMAGIGAGGGAGGAGASYDIHLSELELQQREMELQFQRQRLQLVKEREREALFAREKEGADSGSERDFRPRNGQMGRDPYTNYGRDRDAGYESATSGRDVYGGISLDRDGDRYRSERYNTSQAGTLSHRSHDYLDRRPMDFDNHPPNAYRSRGHNDIDSPRLSPSIASSAGRGHYSSHSRENINYGDETLSPPPPLHQSAGGASPRRSTELGAHSPSTPNLHGTQDHSEAPRTPAARNLEPPSGKESRAVDRVDNAPTSPQTPQGKEKEKGGTWLGKGLKRLSMPLGAGSNSGPTSSGTAGKKSFERRDT